MPRDIRRLRNIGIMAHVDAGKTTCAERMLWLAGRIRTKGEVHHGTTALDFHPIEKKKGITIKAAATSFEWNDHTVTLVDTPGHVDFTIEVERALRVLDGAVFVLDAASGVECQSETVFRQAARHRVPCVAFVNKIDKPGADFAACVADIEEKLDVVAVPIQLPIAEGTVDLLRPALVVEEDGGRARRFVAVPAAAANAVAQARRRVVEACAEVDDAVMDAWCNHRDVAAEDLARALRKGTLARRFLVVLCGAALQDRGVAALLDAVVDLLPSPAERAAVEGVDPRRGVAVARLPREDEPLAALAFKTTHDRSAGLVTWLRVYSGALDAGAQVEIAGRGRARAGRIFVPDADARVEVDRAPCGSIVCVTGLASARTGETVADPRAPIVLEAIRAPDPVVSVVVEPKTARDRDRLGGALAKILACDPSLASAVDPESGRVVLSGMGKLHLEIAVELLAGEHGVDVTTGNPTVAYRETLRGVGTATYRHKKQSGGVGQFAVVTLVVEPGPRGSGVAFVDETTGGAVPKELVPGVERGVRAAAERGVLTGHPVIDVVVRLTDGQAHVKDSSLAAFEIAASFAFREAARVAGVVVLEPVASCEIVAPEPDTGAVLGEIAARRGSVRELTPRTRGLVAIAARMPVASTFDLVPRLRGLTHGRGEARVQPDGYDAAPAEVTKALVDRA